MYKPVVCVLVALVASGSCEDKERIFEGKEVDIGSYPFMASMVSSSTMTKGVPYVHLCATSIITDTWLLTTANCLHYYEYHKENDTHVFVDRHIKETKIVVGASKPQLEPERSVAASQPKNIARMVTHPDFDPKKSENDIGLIQLEDKLSFNQRVAKIEINKSGPVIEDPKPPGKCVLIGWGTKDDIEALITPLLRVHEVSLIPTATCKETFKGRLVPLKQFCAVYKDQSGVTCLGDMGVPLVCGGVLWGVSTLETCGKADKPDVFSRVDNYAAWIMGVVGEGNLVRQKSKADSSGTSNYVNSVILFIAAMLYALQ